MKRLEYVLTEPHEELPAGSFICPVKFEYVPKETKRRLDPYGWSHDPAEMTYAYTKRGFQLIPINKIREVG